MAIFHTSFQMQKEYQIGDSITITFKLTNVSADAYKIAKWGTPLDGMGGPYFSLLRNGEAVAYDGPYFFWDTPTEESLLTIASGETVSAELALTDLFSLARQGSYTLDFSGCIQVQTSSGWSIVSDEDIVSQPSTFNLLAGTLPALLTVGQKERAREKDAAASRPPVVKTSGVPCAPKVIADSERVEKKIRKLHYQLYFRTKKALRELENCDLNNVHYTKVFGEDRTGGTLKNEVISNLRKIITNLETKEYEYNCGNHNECATSGLVAFVYSGRDTIYLCPLWINKPATENYSQIGVLFHEFTHAVCGTKDKKYGREACIQLARQSPEDAIVNADNYRIFLEFQFLHWQGNQSIVLNPESNYAPGMVTFQDTIYSFYKGKKSNTLYFMTYNGASWRKNEKIADQPNTSMSPGTSTTPSPVVYRNCIYLFYKGGSNNNLYYLWFDGTNWKGNTKISDSDPKTDAAPSAVFFNNRIYVFFKGSGNNNLYYLTCEYNRDWVVQHSFYSQKIADAPNSNISPRSDCAPSAAVLGDKIYVVYKSDSGNDLFYLTFDGTNWEGDKRISQFSDFAPKTDKAPTVSAVDDMLYITYKGESSNSMYQMYYNRGTGLEDGIWYGNQTVASVSTIEPLTNQPYGVVSLGNYNYSIYKGQKSDQLYFMYQSK